MRRRQSNSSRSDYDDKRRSPYYCQRGRIAFEQLERRRVLATLVSTAADENDGFIVEVAPPPAELVWAASVDPAQAHVTLEAREPPGSLIYARSFNSGVLPPPSDIDSFSIDLQIGQTLAVVADPDAGLQPTIGLFNPGGQQIGSATASAAGTKAILPLTPITAAGSYTISLTGAFGTIGAAAVEIVLNAAVEGEYHLGVDNSTPATAESLESSFIPLGMSADRGAVLGSVDASEDWYSFTLRDRESATLMLAGDDTADRSLELFSSEGNRLVVGVSATNADQAINRFVDATADGDADTYFAKVHGAMSGEYRLVILRNADFDTESNATLSTAQNISGASVVLGHLGRVPEEQSPSGIVAFDNDQYAEPRFIVRFANAATNEERAAALSAIQAKVVRELPIINAALVEITEVGNVSMSGNDAPATSLRSRISNLAAIPAIAYLEPDYPVHIANTFPNDPRFSELTGLHNTAQSGGTADADIDAPEAWDVFTGLQSVVLASIDSGVDYTHPDLAANMWTNPGEIAGDMIDNDGNGYVDDMHGIDTLNRDSNPSDDNGHGTHTAGILGAVGNNGIGIVGVNWNTRIMALKFLDSSGNGLISDAVSAIQYMVMMKTSYGVNVVVSNNSWGGPDYSNALHDAIQASAEAGILFVAAAGNDTADTDRSPFYPANFGVDNVISVAASDRDDHLASFSNYGLRNVHLAAPGVNVLSTLPNNQYGTKNGTSMAAPHVAGAAALLMAYHPRATVSEVKAAILEGVDQLPAFAGTTAAGGRLNLSGALQHLDDRGDWYHIEVAAGDVLQITTSAPAGAPSWSANGFDPRVELFNPSGVLVGADDNSGPGGRHARLTHTALATGSYAIHVSADVEPGGEYLLTVTGATAPLSRFSVAAVDPLVWDLRSSPAAMPITVHFNHSVLLTSLSAADLTLNGTPAISVTVVDGNTATFVLPATLTEGLNQLRFAEGALVDVQGTSIEPYTDSILGLRDTITVTTDLDENDWDLRPNRLSLREALAISSLFSGSHVIRFDPHLRGSTIVLDTSLGPLRIASDVAIEGFEPAQLSIDAAGRGRIWEVDAGTTASISGFTLKRGWSGSTGGAIQNAGNLTVSDTHIIDHFALRDGGAIANLASHTPATLMLRNTVISGNSAGHDGGAIWNYADASTATLTILDSTVANNRASMNGGAIELVATAGGRSTVTAGNSTFSVNRALGGSGGALFEAGGNLEATFSEVVIRDNFANSWGGALFLNQGSATITNAIFTGNSSRYSGGAINATSVAFTMASTVVFGNSAGWDGGGISLDESTALISATTIAGNLAGSSGGGIQSHDGELTLIDATIAGNSADSFAGGIESRSQLTMTNVTVSGNSARSFSGGIFINANTSSLSALTNVTIFGNTCPVAPGLQLVSTGTTVLVRNSIVQHVVGPEFLGSASSNNLIGGNPQLGPLANNGGPTQTHALLPGSAAIDAGDPFVVAGIGNTPVFDQRGSPFGRVRDGNGDGTIRIDIGAFELGVPSSVRSRHVFYNDSKFDLNDAATNVNDDSAIATDKTALLPGGTASFANYTSYHRGLNGIMVDIADLPAGLLSASDFDFKVGNLDTTSAWTALGVVPTIAVRPTPGIPNSSRVTLIWPSGATIKQWLQVTVKANANTGLAVPDVFYFGNAVGESGNVAVDYSVSITDELLARNNPVSINPGTLVTNRFDYNRDGTVSVVDQLLARNNITTVASKLKQITVPSLLQVSTLAAQDVSNANADIAHGLASHPIASQPTPLRKQSIDDVKLGYNGRRYSELEPQTLQIDQTVEARRRAVRSAASIDDDLLALLVSRR